MFCKAHSAVIGNGGRQICCKGIITVLRIPTPLRVGAREISERWHQRAPVGMVNRIARGVVYFAEVNVCAYRLAATAILVEDFVNPAGAHGNAV